MTEILAFMAAIVVGLPAVFALIIRGIEWYQERQALLARSRADAYFGGREDDPTARALLAWWEARPSQQRQGLNQGLNHTGDRASMLRERSGPLSPDAFQRDAYRFSLGSPHMSARPAGTASGTRGFASVHLLLNDGAGRYFRVERRLCLN